MSKGNMLLGMARGKVGDIVFQRLKGQQIVKSRNRNPNNPRTNAQMTQRAIFAAAGQFYSRALQAQFKFAYENKLEKQSDYNVFMKLNSKNGIYLTPEMVQNHSIAIPGPWVTSKGTLQSLDVRMVDVSGAKQVCVPIPLAADVTDATLAQVSQAFISKYNLQNGDIITMWCQSNNITVLDSGEMDVVDKGESTTRWYIKQFILDTSSEDKFTGLWAGDDNAVMVLIAGGSTYQYLTLNISDIEGGWSDEIPCIGGAIVSRNINGKVKTGTSVAMMNETAQLVYDFYRSVAWQEQCLLAWQASGEAILKGGEAVNGSGNSIQDIGVESFSIVDNGDNSFSIKVTPENYNLAIFRASAAEGTLTKQGEGSWVLSGISESKSVSVTVTERVSGLSKSASVAYAPIVEKILTVPGAPFAPDTYEVMATVKAGGLDTVPVKTKITCSSSDSNIRATVQNPTKAGEFEILFVNVGEEAKTAVITVGYEGYESITFSVTLTVSGEI